MTKEKPKFRIADIPKAKESPILQEKPKIYYPDDLISIYTAFREQVYSPKSVLYPSCGYDASPAKAFPNVTFVDKEEGNEGCIESLKTAGHKAFKQDIRDYTPKEQHDLLILLNPAILTERASRHLVHGGWIIANDYHSNAGEMAQNPRQYTLWGTIDFVERDRRKGDNRVVISRTLDDLFVPVKDAKEFKRLRPSDYQFEHDVIEHWIKTGMLRVDKKSSFEEKWRAYREQLREDMPYKRVADRYVFLKR